MRFTLKIFFALISIVSFSSCTSVYYVGETTDAVNIYSKIDTTSAFIHTIPKGSVVLTKKRSRKYYYVVYTNHKGYVYRPAYRNYRRYNSLNDGVLYGYSTIKTKKNTSYKANNYNSSSGGRVNVKGYYRKNGTYVKPYTRKSPSRRKY